MSDDCLTVPRLRAAMATLGVATLQEILEPRTVALGPWWVRFETSTTILWQLAQMARVEGIEDDAALQAECDVYTAWVPKSGLLVTVGQTEQGTPAAVDAQSWQALTQALPHSLRLQCGDATWHPESITPGGQTCRALFSVTPELRACFADPAAVVHCHLQTFNARLPDILQRALFKHSEPS